ncbi:MAG: hypothetical protein MUF42_02045 [Cytophagaceae bacterium]|jgi:hypothetical protein|nr:hypothetical protein [Cytophagaceae bacterium]
MRSSALLIYLLLFGFGKLLAQSKVMPIGNAEAVLLSKTSVKSGIWVAEDGKMEWKKVEVLHPEFKEAHQIHVLQTSKDSWKQQLVIKCKKKIESNDILWVSFYARKVYTEEDDEPATLAVVFEKASPDWEKHLYQFVDVTTEWKQYFYPIKVEKTYEADQSQLNFQIGFKKQILEIAHVELLNFKKAYAVEDLPSSPKTVKKIENETISKTVKTSAVLVLGNNPMNSMKMLVNSGLANAQQVPVSNQAFDKAQQIEVKVESRTAWDIQWLAGIMSPVEQNDILMISFMARAISSSYPGEKGQMYCVFEKAEPPYDKSVNERILIDKEWKEFHVPFVVRDNYSSGKANITFHIGGKRQQLEIADLHVLNFKKKLKVVDLPSYKGTGASNSEETVINYKVLGNRPMDKIGVSSEHGKAIGKTNFIKGNKDFNVSYIVEPVVASKNPWSVQAIIKNETSLEKGQDLILTFYARSYSVEKPFSITCVFERFGGDYTKSMIKPIELNKDWKKFTYTFKVAENYAPGEASLNFQLGGPLLHPVEIAGVELINQTVKLKSK